jgi:phosphoglycerate dehydrogenase-like enzyme
MTRPTALIVGVFLLLLFPLTLLADNDVEKLISQTGIKEGSVSLRDFSGWREPRKIVVRAPDELVGELRRLWPDVEFVKVTTEAEAIEQADGAEAIIGFCSTALLDAAVDASWIQVFSAGVERCVALEQVGSAKVVLTNMQKMSSPVLAEHAVAMVMALGRGLVSHGKLMATGEWRRGGPAAPKMQEISGKTLLVAGLGGIGTEVARRAAALGMRVVGTRRSSRDGPDFVDYVGLSSELHELAADADFIVNALPLTPETSGIFDQTFFADAKQGSYFISVGRGASVVTDDLVRALETGQLAGAGLDVTDPEPLPSDHRLWQMENVIITPHVAGWGGGRERHYTLVKENIRRFITGDKLFNVVDPQRGY